MFAETRQKLTTVKYRLSRKRATSRLFTPVTNGLPKLVKKKLLVFHLVNGRKPRSNVVGSNTACGVFQVVNNTFFFSTTLFKYFIEVNSGFWSFLWANSVFMAPYILALPYRELAACLSVTGMERYIVWTYWHMFYYFVRIFFIIISLSCSLSFNTHSTTCVH